MNIWLAVSLILVVTTIYLFMIEVFSVAFKLTGLATSKIRFQVASLFTGTGFTTSESELITNDERRRKIALACIYSGHIFSVVFLGLVINVFVTLGTTLKSNSVSETFTEWYFIVFYVASSLFIFILFIKIPPINKRFQKLLEAIAITSIKNNRNSNFINVFDMYGKHAIAEVILNKVPDFAKEIPLYQMGLTKSYSINILSIKRGKRIIDVSKDTMISKGDVLIVYGVIKDIKEAFIYSVKNKNKDVKSVEEVKTNELTLINNYGANALVEVYVDEVPKELVNTKIKDSHLSDRYNITIGIIKRNDEYIFFDRDTIIEKGDTLTLIGPYQTIKLLFQNTDKGTK